MLLQQHGQVLARLLKLHVFVNKLWHMVACMHAQVGTAGSWLGRCEQCMHSQLLQAQRTSHIRSGGASSQQPWSTMPSRA